MIHVDTLKRMALWLLVVICAVGWYRARADVASLQRVGTELVTGWDQCLTTLTERQTKLNAELNAAIGRGIR